MKFYELLQAMAFGPAWKHLQSYYDLEERLFGNFVKAFHVQRLKLDYGFLGTGWSRAEVRQDS